MSEERDRLLAAMEMAIKEGELQYERSLQSYLAAAQSANDAIRALHAHDARADTKEEG